MISTGSLFCGLIFGSIGTGYFMYGKKQQHIVALLSGIALCVVPYLFTSVLLIVLFCAVFVVLPFVLKFE